MVLLLYNTILSPDLTTAFCLQPKPRIVFLKAERTFAIRFCCLFMNAVLPDPLCDPCTHLLGANLRTALGHDVHCVVAVL